MLGDILITTSVSLFIADFNLFNCEFNNLYLFYTIESFYIIKTKNYKIFTVPCENSKIVSFTSSRMK